MTTPPPIPCMVAVRKSDGAVSVLPLVETRVGLALYAEDEYRRIGQLRPATWTEPGRRGEVTRKGFTWYFDDPEYGRDNGRERTEQAAVAALLRAGGYVEAPANAANPGLFDEVTA